MYIFKNQTSYPVSLSWKYFNASGVFEVVSLFHRRVLLVIDLGEEIFFKIHKLCRGVEGV